MGRLTRRQREKRVQSLVLVSGGAAIGAAVLLVLSVLGVVGFGPVLVLLIVAVAAGFLARSSLSP